MPAVRGAWKEEEGGTEEGGGRKEGGRGRKEGGRVEEEGRKGGGKREERGRKKGRRKKLRTSHSNMVLAFCSGTMKLFCNTFDTVIFVIHMMN